MMERIPTFVPNLDEIIGGGLPAHSIVLISGVPGSGKTVLANQIIYGNATSERKGLVVSTVSEPLVRILRYTQEFTFFDPRKMNSAVFYEDLGPLLLEGCGEKALQHIEEMALKMQPAFLVVDSIRAIHDLSSSPAATRRSFFRLAATLSTLPCTAFLVGEYHPEDVPHTVEASIADVLLYLDNRSTGPYDRRILKVRKMRGSAYIPGEHTFRISSDGLTVFPRLVTPAQPLKYTPGRERVPTGIPGYDDKLFPGGLLRGTTTLLAGDPGVGKTVTALHFLLNGARQGEAGAYISFQEDPSQLVGIARNFGFNVEELSAERNLAMLYTSPVELNIDEHALKITALVQEIKARRVAIDSISALEMGAGGDRERFFSFMYSLVQWFKDHGITAFLTAEMGKVFASEFALTGRGVSHIADNIVLMRYTEISGEIRRAVTVLAARGSDHGKGVYEYLISEKEGPRVDRPLSSAFNLFSPTAEKE